jgi:hypothetical protein
VPAHGQLPDSLPPRRVPRTLTGAVVLLWLLLAFELVSTVVVRRAVALPWPVLVVVAAMVFVRRGSRLSWWVLVVFGCLSAATAPFKVTLWNVPVTIVDCGVSVAVVALLASSSTRAFVRRRDDR